MKKSFAPVLFTVLFLSFQTVGFAQNLKNGQRPTMTPEQRTEHRANVMVKQLLLDDATTAKFLPLYKQYLTEMQSCQFRKKVKGFGDKKVESMNDKEIKAMLDLRFSESRRILDIREKYYKTFSKMLTPRQLWSLYSREKAMSGRMKKEMERRKGKFNKHQQYHRGHHGSNQCPTPDNCARN